MPHAKGASEGLPGRELKGSTTFEPDGESHFHNGAQRDPEPWQVLRVPRARGTEPPSPPTRDHPSTGPDTYTVPQGFPQLCGQQHLLRLLVSWHLLPGASGVLIWTGPRQGDGLRPWTPTGVLRSGLLSSHWRLCLRHRDALSRPSPPPPPSHPPHSTAANQSILHGPILPLKNSTPRNYPTSHKIISRILYSVVPF